MNKSEKKFLAYSIIRGSHFFESKYKNYISLYSYIDQTNDSLKDQKKYKEEYDPYISMMIRNLMDTKHSKYKRGLIFKELKKMGYFDSEEFTKKFEEIVKWIDSEDSVTYFEEARLHAYREYKRIQDEERLLEKSRIHATYIANKEKIDAEYQLAMVKLGKNAYRKQEATSDLTSSNNWGRTRRPKLDTDSSEWQN